MIVKILYLGLIGSVLVNGQHYDRSKIAIQNDKMNDGLMQVEGWGDIRGAIEEKHINYGPSRNDVIYRIWNRTEVVVEQLCESLKQLSLAVKNDNDRKSLGDVSTQICQMNAATVDIYTDYENKTGDEMRVSLARIADSIAKCKSVVEGIVQDRNDFELSENITQVDWTYYALGSIKKLEDIADRAINETHIDYAPVTEDMLFELWKDIDVESKKLCESLRQLSLAVVNDDVDSKYLSQIFLEECQMEVIMAAYMNLDRKTEADIRDVLKRMSDFIRGRNTAVWSAFSGGSAGNHIRKTENSFLDFYKKAPVTGRNISDGI